MFTTVFFPVGLSVMKKQKTYTPVKRLILFYTETATYIWDSKPQCFFFFLEMLSIVDIYD